MSYNGVCILKFNIYKLNENNTFISFLNKTITNRVGKTVGPSSTSQTSSNFSNISSLGIQPWTPHPSLVSCSTFIFTCPCFHHWKCRKQGSQRYSIIERNVVRSNTEIVNYCEPMLYTESNECHCVFLKSLKSPKMPL